MESSKMQVRIDKISIVAMVVVMERLRSCRVESCSLVAPLESNQACFLLLLLLLASSCHFGSYLNTISLARGCGPVGSECVRYSKSIDPGTILD